MSEAYQPKRIGVLGGGQLGKMLIQQAANLDLEMWIIDPDPNAPCATLATHFVNASFQDYDNVLEFGRQCDVVTVEIENVNVDALEQLEKEGKQVYPQPAVLRMVKDKGIQKTFYSDNGFPTSDFQLIADQTPITSGEIQPPFVQKLRTGGYDGRGVQVIKSEANFADLFTEPSVVEDLVDIDLELSVVVARNVSGQVKSFPIVEMVANEANLLDYLVAPGRVSAKIESEARQLAEELITKMDMVGLLAVELFLDKAGNISINEVAPRPHNSGHHTIEANISSQYEQHLRAILDLPLGDTATLQPAVMINILGEPGYEGLAKYNGLSEVVAESGVHIHLYGKKQTRGMRKMGHMTIMDPSLDKAIEKAEKIRTLFSVTA